MKRSGSERESINVMRARNTTTPSEHAEYCSRKRRRTEIERAAGVDSRVDETQRQGPVHKRAELIAAANAHQCSVSCSNFTEI